MSFLRTYIKKYWKPFSAAIFFLTIEAFCDLLQPTIMSKIVDVGVVEKKMHYVLWAGLIMLGVTAVGAFAAVGRNFLASHVSQRFGRDLRLDLFKKIQGFSFDNIDRFEPASLVIRLTNDVTQVQNFVNGIMRIFVKAPLLCIGGVIMASIINPEMAMILIAAVPIIAVIIFVSIRFGYPFFIRVQTALDRVNGVMREYLSGVRVVKAFNRFDYEKARFHHANQELAGYSTVAMRMIALFSPIMTLIVNLGILAVLWYGGMRVNQGHMHVGQIIAFINYMTQILFALMMMTFIFNMFVRARASSERIGKVFAAEETMPVPTQPKEIQEADGRVDFNHVFFSYATTSGEPVLKDIDWHCGPGQILGIIGSTGSGKSSLVHLIPRFYDVTSGEVRVNGTDVREVNSKALRERIAVVPQKAVLFTGTILENIRWGKEDATVEEVERAAEIAQAHDFIRGFPEGYQTMLGQGGVNLSGGQKQRLSIARALVRKPEILILDDSTSAVDVATEMKIWEALKAHARGLTCFVIAQRISSVARADQIAVLDGGSMVGLGNHRELLKDCEVYRDIFRSQIGKEGIRDGQRKQGK